MQVPPGAQRTSGERGGACIPLTIANPDIICTYPPVGHAGTTRVLPPYTHSHTHTHLHSSTYAWFVCESPCWPSAHHESPPPNTYTHSHTHIYAYAWLACRSPCGPSARPVRAPRVRAWWSGTTTSSSWSAHSLGHPRPGLVQQDHSATSHPSCSTTRRLLLQQRHRTHYRRHLGPLPLPQHRSTALLATHPSCCSSKASPPSRRPGVATPPGARCSCGT